MPWFDLWRRCRHREKGVFSVVEVVLEKGWQYARSGSIVSLPNRWIPPIRLLLLDTTVDVNPLYAEVPPVLDVLSVPGVVPHLRGLIPLRPIDTPGGRNVRGRGPRTRNRLRRMGGSVVLHELRLSVLPVDLLIARVG